MAKNIMHHHADPSSGWDITIPHVDEQGSITSEAAVPPSAIHYFYEGSDTGRCITCGVPSCSTGVVKKSVKFGCPFGHDMPDMHYYMEQAQRVFNDAFMMLKKFAPETAQAIEDLQADLTDPDIAFKRALAPMVVFEALEKEVGLVTVAQSLRKQYNVFTRLAYDTSEEKGPMHDVFSRLCSDSLCHFSCVPENTGQGKVQITVNMARLADHAALMGWTSERLVPKNGKNGHTLLIVGSGFAGHCAAYQGIKLGYDVVMVGKNEEAFEPGGKNILPNKTILERFRHHTKRLENSDMTNITGTDVDGPVLQRLIGEFNPTAVLFTTGASIDRTVTLKGRAADTVITWGQVLQQQQQVNNKDLSTDDYNPDYNLTGKTVVVVGTSDSAVDIDVVGALQGAKKVIMTSRGTHFSATDLPAWEKAQKIAKAKGVELEVLYNFKGDTVDYTEDGRKVFIGKHAQDGHQVAVPCDAVVLAIGNHSGDQKVIYDDPDIPTYEDGCFKPDREGGGYLKTNEDGVFYLAAGDCTRPGGSLAAVAGADAWNLVARLDEELNREDGAQPFSSVDLNPPSMA